MQFSYCHNYLRNFEKPLKTVITGLGPKTKQILSKYEYDKWLVDFKTEDYLELYQKKDLIYLSGDAEEEMEEFDDKYFKKSYLYYRGIG